MTETAIGNGYHGEMIKMNRNDIDIRKGKCCRKDNVRFDEYFSYALDKWSSNDDDSNSYDHVIYLEYAGGYYYYFVWDDDGDGFLFRQRDEE